MVDSLRADRLDFHDSARALTPFLDSLAKRGNVFWNTYAQSSWTMPSVASLWTSRYPSQHRVTKFGSGLAATERPLAEVLKQSGYATAAFSANPLLGAPGFKRGFDRYDDGRDALPPGSVKHAAEHLNRQALAWLDALGSSGTAQAPVFMYLHYMEPHCPYLPAADALEHVLRQREQMEAKRQLLADLFFTHQREWQHPDALMQDLIRDLYDAEVWSLDVQMRTFFGALDRRGFLADTLVVITADHGEELVDHGGIGHGKTLFNEVIRIPLLLLVPGQSGRHDIYSVHSEVDIAPTVLDLAGIRAPASFEGRSLRAVLQPGRVLQGIEALWQRVFPGNGDNPAAAFSELLGPPDEKDPAPPHVFSIVVGLRKLIVDKAGLYSTYDLVADPGENNSQAFTAAERAVLERVLEAQIERAERRVAIPRTEAPDEQTRERMRALGYGS